MTFFYSLSINFSEKCINPIRSVIKKMKIPSMDLINGTGHNSVYVSKVIPASMLFIPCKDGLSHNELESAKKENIANITYVLLNTILEI